MSNLSSKQRAVRQRRVLPWQASYMRRAYKVRRALTNKSIAKILGLTENIVKNYTSNLHRVLRG